MSQKLRNLANSAPGQDGLEYRHLRLLDPKCKILAKLYAKCFEAKDAPAAWKTATTILIHKKDSTRDPNEQKSARSSKGCYEHAFLLESLVNDARRQPRPLCLAWLDIRNAFGSIPRSALITTLTHMGFPPELVAMIGNVYTGATTEVLTPLGKTSPIPIHSGVKQGCPLSAILFNLGLELIIRKCSVSANDLPCGPLKHHGIPMSILAYADDLVIMARNPNALQHLFGAVSDAADVHNLKFRADKCASLSMVKDRPRVIDSTYLVQGSQIPPMSQEDHYR